MIKSKVFISIVMLMVVLGLVGCVNVNMSVFLLLSFKVLSVKVVKDSGSKKVIGEKVSMLSS